MSHKTECNDNDDRQQINQNYDNRGLDQVQTTVPSLLTAKPTDETATFNESEILEFNVRNMQKKLDSFSEVN